jgi:hypothetical protein
MCHKSALEKSRKTTKINWDYGGFVNYSGQTHENIAYFFIGIM